jgi:transcriptional regulator with PAS, ATPase and Fis domain
VRLSPASAPALQGCAHAAEITGDKNRAAAYRLAATGGRDIATGAKALTLADAVEQAEIRALEGSLARHKGNYERAAAELAISPTTLWRRMNKLGIKRD